MCRILAGLVEEPGDGILYRFLDSLVDASRSDPLNDGKSHPHGWGYVLVGSGIFEYRTGLPIYEDARALEELKHRVMGAPNIFIVHTRRKSPRTPAGPQHSHPYHYGLENGIDMWIAFNGWIKVDDMKYKCSRDTMTQKEYSSSPKINVDDTRYRSDAYFLARTLSMECEEEKGLDRVSECIYSVYKGMADTIISGGNLAYLLYDGTSAVLGFIPVYAGDRKTYYAHYTYTGRGVFLIASSSIIHTAGVEGAEKLEEWRHLRRKLVFSEHRGRH